MKKMRTVPYSVLSADREIERMRELLTSFNKHCEKNKGYMLFFQIRVLQAILSSMTKNADN